MSRVQEKIQLIKYNKTNKEETKKNHQHRTSPLPLPIIEHKNNKATQSYTL